MFTSVFQGEAGIRMQAEAGGAKIAKDQAEAMKAFQKQIEDLALAAMTAGHTMEELGISQTDLTRINERQKNMLRALVSADEKTLRIIQRMRREDKSVAEIRAFEIRQGQKAAKVLFEKAEKQRALNKAAAWAAKKINLLNQALTDMAGAIKAVAERAFDTAHELKSLFGSITGRARIQTGGSSEEIVRVLKDIRNSTTEEIGRAERATSVMLGPGPAAELMSSGIDTSKRLENILPTFVQSLAGMKAEDRAQAIRDAFKGGGLLDFVPEEMQKALEQSLQRVIGEGTRQGLTAGDIAQDPEKIAAIIGSATEHALAPAIAVWEAASKGREMLVKALDQTAQMSMKVGMIYDKASKIQQNTNNVVAKALGKFEDMSLEDMTSAFRESMERRTGMDGPVFVLHNQRLFQQGAYSTRKNGHCPFDHICHFCSNSNPSSGSATPLEPLPATSYRCSLCPVSTSRVY